MDKFKVGDKVKLISMDGEASHYYEYLNKIFTIKGFGSRKEINFAKLEETNEINPFLTNLELVKYTYEDLKKSPIGTKITFGNGNMFMKYTEDKFINLSAIRSIEWLSNLRDNFGQLGKIIKIEEPTYKIDYEYKEEILDETEKRYLRGVIRPFRDKIKYICKSVSDFGKYEYIKVNLGNDTLVLPDFKPNTMYKGMKTDKQYTLEELGL